MKQKDGEINRLCRTCRRKCKQTAMALIASCPQYYPLPLDLRRLETAGVAVMGQRPLNHISSPPELLNGTMQRLRPLRFRLS